jgi:Aspartyl protease
MTARSPRQFILVPFAREKSRHITVVATLRGRPVRFIVDTGAGGTCIDLAAVPRFKLEISSASRKGGGVGSSVMRMGYVVSHDLRLGGVDLSATKLTTLDLSHVNDGFKQAKVKPIVGVLGADILWSRHALIDYAKSILLISV